MSLLSAQHIEAVVVQFLRLRQECGGDGAKGSKKSGVCSQDGLCIGSCFIAFILGNAY